MKGINVVNATEEIWNRGRTTACNENREELERDGGPGTPARNTTVPLGE
jgi:hypothetical protein